MRILGIDFGRKRCGLAVSDPMGWTAQPLALLEVDSVDKLVAAIGKIVGDKGIDEIVLGLPRNMDNSLGSGATEVLALQARLESEFEIPVHTWDERLTTVRAERAMLSADMSRAKRKRKRDTVAAQFILQAFLDSRSRPHNTEETSGEGP